MSEKVTVKVVKNITANITMLIKMILEYVPDEKVLEIRRRAVSIKNHLEYNDAMSNLIFQAIIDEALDKHPIIKKVEDDAFGQQM